MPGGPAQQVVPGVFDLADSSANGDPVDWLDMRIAVCAKAGAAPCGVCARLRPAATGSTLPRGAGVRPRPAVISITVAARPLGTPPAWSQTRRRLRALVIVRVSRWTEMQLSPQEWANQAQSLVSSLRKCEWTSADL